MSCSSSEEVKQYCPDRTLERKVAPEKKSHKSRLVIYDAPEITDATTIVDMAKHHPEAWREAFVDEYGEVYPDIVHVQSLLERKGYIASMQPPVEKIFRAFERLRPEDVRVIFVGMDPYHSGVATGLSFSVEKGVAIPSSLQNIYKELSQCDPKIVCPDPVNIENSRWVKPNHGDLCEWESQGVLMLNRCLTTNYGKAGAHGKIYDGFIRRVLRLIMKKAKENGRTVVFLLLGRDTQGVIFMRFNKPGDTVAAVTCLEN